NGCGIEDRNVCKISWPQPTTTHDADSARGKRSHLAYGLGDGHELFAAHVAGVNAGKVAEGARMCTESKEDSIDAFGVGVGAKADPREHDLFPNIVLAHQEVDGLDARIILDHQIHRSVFRR